MMGQTYSIDDLVIIGCISMFHKMWRYNSSIAACQYQIIYSSAARSVYQYQIIQ
jgi:hypothetical protein